MADNAADTSRVGWLDGLRGFAAMQVVLLHYALVFLPALGSQNPQFIHFGWELHVIGTPLTLLFDGTLAVYLFFIMSGVVLTYAFNGRHQAVPRIVIRRVIRLWLPMAATLLLTAILFSAFPSAHLTAFRILRMSWLGTSMPASVSAASIGHQIVFEGLLTGYRDQGFLPHWAAVALSLQPMDQARNPPLWTLHIEFVGSLLVLALVTLRASVGQATYRLICLVLFLCFLASPLALFIIGHWVAPRLGQVGKGMWRRALAVSCLILSILLCTRTIVLFPPELLSLLRSPPIGPSIEPRDFQIMLSAILLFVSLHQLPILRRVLETPAMRWFGKISFSLYLTHFPVLFTVTAAIYVVVAAYLPFSASLSIGGLAGMAVSLALAVLFERWIDRPAINLSRMVGAPRQHRVTPAPVIKAA